MSSVVPVFENVGKRCTTKNYRPVILLAVVRKILEQLKNSRLADYIENVRLGFLISSMVSGFLVRVLTVLSNEVLELLIDLGLLEQ